MTVTVTVTCTGLLNFTIQYTVFNKGPPKPPAARCNIILLSAGVGISLPRPFTLVISPKSFSFLALVFRSTVFVSTCKKRNPLVVVVPRHHRLRGRLARVRRNGCAEDCRLVGWSRDLSYVRLPHCGSSLLVGGLPRGSALATRRGLTRHGGRAQN